MKFLPLFHRACEQSYLIVGGGQIALRRARTLLSAGADVHVVASHIDARLVALVGEQNAQQRDYQSADVSRQFAAVIAATDNAEVNRQVAADARALNIPVNVADDQDACDFIFSSVIDRDPLTIAVSNSGQSPVLSKLLKQQIEMFVPKGYGELAALVGEYRQQVNQLISEPEQRSQFWQTVLQGRVAEALFSGQRERARALLERAINDLEGFTQVGEVYLIGAGPGDPDLLTLRAFRLIQQADVVIYDRLVSEGIMALVSEDTEKYYVGKQRSNHAVPQEGINQLLVDYAKQGKRVARLKGGDPFIFGRGGEEIETLAEQQIPFQVVPGITAANGCSSYSGIPLTHRDYAQSVQFVTGQLKDGSVNLNWPELIREDKTIVFYMGLSTLPQISQQLIEHGMASDMTCALVERGTTLDQRVFTGTLETLAALIEREQVVSPALFIVGRVVKLAEKLDWYSAGEVVNG